MGKANALMGQTGLYCSNGERFRLVEVQTKHSSIEAETLNIQKWQVAVQQKHTEAQQGPNSAHRLKTRRDRRTFSIESNHFQHPFSKRSTCLQCLNR